jgi:uncharacterized protein (TIGR03435 family)
MAIRDGLGHSLGRVRDGLLVGLFACTAAFGQAAGAKPAFDVASVRLSRPDAPLRGQELLMSFTPDAIQNGLLSLNAPVSSFIIFAYHLTDTSSFRPLYEQLPPWAQTSHYVIEARAEGSPSRDQMRLMMQSLLEDRFKLKTHVETKPAVVYDLVLEKPGKTGPQLHAHDEARPCVARPAETERPAAGAAAPVYCGVDIVPMEGHLRLRVAGMSMPAIANFLGGAAGYIGGMENHPVVDQTGLTGRYDLTLDFARASEPSADATASSADIRSVGPAVGDALKSQLGLRLVEKKGMASRLVVDHIEPPSAN